MIRCIIVEDEILAQNVIESHLQRTQDFKLISVCNNALEAKEILDKEKVDLIFLDIQLPGMTGLHFLKSLPYAPFVVFTTAYAEHAVESYDFNVIDYLLKPISFERFSKTINKIIGGKLFNQNTAQKESESNYTFIKSGNRFFKVNFSEILYVEGMKDYIKIFAKGFTLITHQTMNEMEKSLPGKEFLRIHRSYIISLKHIQSINSSTIKIREFDIPIGVNYKEKISELISNKIH